MPPAAQAALLGIVGGGGLALLGAAGVGKLVVAINEAKIAMAALGWSAKGVGAATAAIGGVLGLAALAVSKFAEAQAEARQDVEAYTASLDAQTGAITENTRTLAASALEKAGALEAANRLGIESGLLVDALLGEAAAMDTLNGMLDTYQGTSEMGAAERQQMMDDRDAIAGAVGREADKLDEAEAAAQREADAIRETEAATVAATEAVEAQIPTLQELIDLQREAAGVVLSERDAQRAFQQSIDDATAALEANGTTLDTNTDAGRANQSALDDIASSGWDVVDSMRANGATQESLQATMQTTRDAFINQATAAGMSADEASRLADELGLIPAKVAVDVSVDTSAAEQRLATFRALLNMPDVVISADLRDTGGYYAQRAAGGPVQGPRTTTSTSIAPTSTEELR